VKADTLGSLEAMMAALEEAEVAAVRAEVGAIAPRDVTVASTGKTEQEQVIVGFNVPCCRRLRSCWRRRTCGSSARM